MPMRIRAVVVPRRWRIVLAVVLAAALSALPTDYYLLLPGVTTEMAPMVEVEGGGESPTGSFLLTSVYTRKALGITYLIGAFHPGIELISQDKLIPEGWDIERYQQHLRELMQASHDTARVVALREAGYPVRTLGEGVKIIAVLEDSPAKGLLQEGDTIVSLEGELVFMAEDLVTLVQERKPGDQVKLVVKRPGRPEAVEIVVPTTSHSEAPGRAALRILISSLDWKAELPREIKVNTADIGGPSAGLVLTLEMIDQLLPQNLTGGWQVAGTGTISLRGAVGPVGGVKQKAISARKSGAEIFLVPVANYEEALAGGGRALRVVPVRNLEEAMAFLRALPPKPAAEDANPGGKGREREREGDPLREGKSLRD
ncbi:MAG: PDZ domain-containing protein [Firmicutes bacterium]|nr:PDZ domain-containing protein [Bacillota bacterium]